MRRLTTDLKDIVESVRIRSAGSFSIAGEAFEDPSRDSDIAALPARLAEALYQRKYCRPDRRGSNSAPDSRAARMFVDDLSSANSGGGTWQSGWVVERLDTDGRLVVRNERDDLTVWARPEQFRSAGGDSSPGTAGRLQVGKELREMLPGYYAMLGNTAEASYADPSRHGVVRFYWHLTADVASFWTRELTRRFNAAGVGFHAKVHNDPNAYFRADSGVLYVGRADAAGAIALLPQLHAAVAQRMRATIPMFTKRLARGLALAEDPGDGRSFGQHRCQLLAEGLVRAFEAGRSTPAGMADAIAGRFTEDGLDIGKPWLNAGSRDVYIWPRRTPSRRLATE